MSTAELVALELRLDAERAVRSEDALAPRLIDRLKRRRNGRDAVSGHRRDLGPVSPGTLPISHRETARAGAWSLQRTLNPLGFSMIAAVSCGFSAVGGPSAWATEAA